MQTMQMTDGLFSKQLPTVQLTGAAGWDFLIYTLAAGTRYLLVSHDRIDDNYTDPLYHSNILDALSCATRRKERALLIPMCILEEPNLFGGLLARKQRFNRTEMLLWRNFYEHEFTSREMITFLKSTSEMGYKEASRTVQSLMDKLLNARMAKRLSL